MAIRGRSPTGFKQKGPLKKKSIDVEISKFIGIWLEMEKAAAEAVMAVFDTVGYKILFDAVNTCPYETGMLRRSARGDVQLGGSGLKNILYVPEADDAGYFEIKSRPITQKQSIAQHAQRMGGRRMRLWFSFSRTNERGENIAVWTHEELLPFSSRKRRSEYEEETGRSPIYFATKPGTGPKYLENAIAKYHNEIRSETKKIIRHLAWKINEAVRTIPEAKTPKASARKAQKLTRTEINRYRQQKYSEIGILIPFRQAKEQMEGKTPKKVRRKKRKRDVRGRFTR